MHPRCRCDIIPINAIKAGTATKNGVDGADYALKTYGHLPDYYISETEAKTAGYKLRLGNLNEVAAGKMLTKGVYHNWNGHLPESSDRIWYEADINYESGFRNGQRLLYSNDGLVFVTFDHYQTFYEII